MEFFPSDLLTPYNYFNWKLKILLIIIGRGLYQIAMEKKTKPTLAIKKSKYFKCMDEAYGLISMSISLALLFHIESCTTPNKVWTTMEVLFQK
jgi:hypothetical protein